MPSYFGSYRCICPVSRERIALRRLSSMVRPMLMTSPVAFIWVDKVLSISSELNSCSFLHSGIPDCGSGVSPVGLVNLSKGKRGILVTT